MKDYEMELRIVVKIRAHDIEEAQRKASDMRDAMREAFPIETMEYASNYSLLPHYGRPIAPYAGYPDPYNARKLFHDTARREALASADMA
jgi:hypothetical protein